MSVDATHAYVGFCRGCGSMYAAHVDYLDDRRNIARFLGQLAKDGARIERVTIEETRGSLAYCRCKQRDSQQEMFSP